MVKKSPEYQANNNNSNSNSNGNGNGNSIKYKGVRKRKWGKWVSEVRLPNSRERIWLGSYDTPEKAARAFDAAQFCLRGKSANFNFPDDPPEIAGGRSMTPMEIQAAAASFANMSSASMDKERSNGNTIVFEESAEALSYSSPSISDGTTSVQVVDSFEVAGVEASFQEQLSLSATLGSGNYVSDFGYFPAFDEFTAGADFFTMTQSNNNHFDYVGQEDTYDASLYQDSYLWNF